MNSKRNSFIIVLVILICGFIFQKKYINEFPSFIHAWAQSDRYALALGFLNNNFDFFHPQTFVLNHQFPGNYLVPSENGITSVDFPIHDYIPALLMGIFHTTSPWCFRLYILMYSFIGLFFLYKITTLFKYDLFTSILLILFAATSPVFVYYQAGFLPSIPSLANGFIGLFYFIKYKTQNNNCPYYWSILFLTLAALSRTPFSILLLSVVINELFYFLKSKKFCWSKFYITLFSFIIVIGYFLYNIYLRDKYGSMFLNHPMIPQDFNEVKEILKIVVKNWLLQYFSITHYIFLIGIFFVALYQLIKYQLKLSDIQKQTLFITLIILFGTIIYSALMLRQFTNHDYYFLDTFYIPFVLLFLLILSVTSSLIFNYKAYLTKLVVLAICCILLFNTLLIQQKRRQSGYWDNVQQTIINFQNSELLDSLKIPKTSKILDLCSFAPNIPFILMDRSGFATLSTSEENIKNALKWDYDFISIQNEFFLSDVYSNYPDIINRISKVGDNGKISIYKLFEGQLKVSLNDFLDISNKKPAFEREIAFDTVPDKEWHNTKSTKIVKYSGLKAGVVNTGDEFGITFKVKNLDQLKERSTLLYLTSVFLKNVDHLIDCYIVVSVASTEGTIYYKSYNLANLLRLTNSWEQINLTFQLPIINTENYELGVYIWNSGHNNLYYDDIKIQLY